MPDVTDSSLEAMSVQELLDLQAEIHTAIRAAIRKRNEERAAGIAPVREPASQKMDLARERDAWLARRRSAS